MVTEAHQRRNSGQADAGERSHELSVAGVVREKPGDVWWYVEGEPGKGREDVQTASRQVGPRSLRWRIVVMTEHPAERFAEFTTWSLKGEHRQTVRIVRELGEAGNSIESIIQDLLVPSQHEIGRRWQQGEVSVVDEHISTVTVDAALSELSVLRDFVPNGISTLMVCAEGDWHAIAARLCAELLRAQGIEVLFLGGSTPADHVARTVERHRPDAVLISCTIPMFYKGVARIADAIHQCGVPVVAGGRALRGGPDVARQLGADGWAPGAAGVIEVLSDWRDDRPVVDPTPVNLSVEALDLDGRAAFFATRAMQRVNWKNSSPTGYNARQLSHIQENLTWIVRFAGAAQLVDADTVFTEFLDWLINVLDVRGIPREALAAGLSELAVQVESVNHEAAELLELGSIRVGHWGG